jgi:hypothetical protein
MTFPVSSTKRVLRGRQFASTGEVAANATRVLTEVQKTTPRSASKCFTNIGKSVSLPKGTNLKEILCKHL